MSNFNKGVPKAEKNLKKGSGKLETAVDRLNFFVDKYLQGNKTSFYKKTSLANGFLDRSGGIRTGNLEKVSLAFPELNTHWVLTGTGEVLNSEPNFEEQVVSEETFVKPVPVYDTEVFGGKRDLVNTTDYEAIIGWARMPGFEDCIGWTKIKGDSMAPIVKAGDFVAVLPEIDKKYILPGALYIVSFSGEKAPHPMLKYIHLEDGKVLLRSVNSKYKDMVLNMEDIKAIYPARAGVIEF